MRQSVVLLSSTEGYVNLTGDEIKAAGYYGSGYNLYTLALTLIDFSGRITIQASLSNCPEDNDWFDIKLDDPDNYLEFSDVTNVIPVNFTGNFVFLRAILDRSYLPNPEITNYGRIEKILVNF